MSYNHTTTLRRVAFGPLVLPSVLENIDQATSRPGLRRTAIPTECSILLTQLCKPRPRTLFDLSHHTRHPPRDLLVTLDALLRCLPPRQVKFEQGPAVEAQRPAPFGTLVVVTTFGSVEVGRILAVDVEGTVVVVRRIKRLHANWAEKILVRDFQSVKGVVRVEEFRRYRHGYAKVRTQLVVLVLLTATVSIFVDATAVYDLRVDIIVRVFFGRAWDVESALEIGLDLVGPCAERDGFLGWPPS
jgi:hypothetical protein